MISELQTKIWNLVWRISPSSTDTSIPQQITAAAIQTDISSEKPSGYYTYHEV